MEQLSVTIIRHLFVFCQWSLNLALLPYCQEPDVDHQLSAHESPLARQRQLTGVRLDGRWAELRPERKWIAGQHASQWEATATAAIPQERTSVSAVWLSCLWLWTCDVHVPTCTWVNAYTLYRVLLFNMFFILKYTVCTVAFSSQLDFQQRVVHLPSVYIKHSSRDLSLVTGCHYTRWITS